MNRLKVATIHQQNIRVPISRIRSVAAHMVHLVDKTAKLKRIDPDNLIILFGEHHDQLTHSVLEGEFIKAASASRSKVKPKRLCHEIEHRFQNDLRAAAGMGNKEKIVEHISYKQGFFQPYSLPVAYALEAGLSYHAIDLNKNAKRCIVFPDIADCQKQFANNHFFNRLFAENPFIFCNNSLDVSSKNGMLQRDLAMSLHINNLMQEDPGTVIGICGLYHQADGDPRREGRYSLPEMLLHTGKEIITIGLHNKRERDCTDFEVARQEVCKRLPYPVAANYHAHFSIQLPEIPDWPDDGQRYWHNLLKQQVA